MITLRLTGLNMKMHNFTKQNCEYEIDLSGGLWDAFQLCFAVLQGMKGVDENATQ